MRRNFIIVTGIFILVLVAVFGFKAFKAKMIQQFVEKALPAQTIVTAGKVMSVFWEPQLHSVGSARAVQSVDIAPEIGGRVTAIFFRSGEIAKEGQVLIQLNPDVLEAQLMSAQAKYGYSKVTYERQLQLFNQNAGQKQSVDQALADMNQAKAAIEQTKAQLQQLQLKAPFAGVLGLRYVDIGQFVTPGQKLANLRSINPMTVDFSIPEAQLLQVKVGQEITVKSLAYRGEKFLGKIDAVDSQIGVTSRALSVRATVENEKNLLVPDMFLDVTVHLSGGSQCLVVPQMAINYSQIGNFVYLVADNKAIKRYVTVGERRDESIAVLSGLQEGDVVITTGQLKLHDGSPVTIQQPTASGATERENSNS